MKGYKEDQGRLLRMAAFWSMTLLLLFGCKFVHDILIGFRSMQNPLGGIRIPVLGIDLTGAFLIALIIFVGGLLMIRRWQSKPKVADLLIDTESELRKVTWPSLDEVINSSIVVVVCVLIIGLFMAGSDWFIARIMKVLLLGGA